MLLGFLLHFVEIQNEGPVFYFVFLDGELKFLLVSFVALEIE